MELKKDVEWYRKRYNKKCNEKKLQKLISIIFKENKYVFPGVYEGKIKGYIESIPIKWVFNEEKVWHIFSHGLADYFNGKPFQMWVPKSISILQWFEQIDDMWLNNKISFPTWSKQKPYHISYKEYDKLDDIFEDFKMYMDYYEKCEIDVLEYILNNQ